MWSATAACRTRATADCTPAAGCFSPGECGSRPDPDNPNTWLWIPAGATLDEACAAVGCQAGTLAIAGGTEVYSLFLTIGYDVFYLARAEEVRLPAGSGLLARPFSASRRRTSFEKQV